MPGLRSIPLVLAAFIVSAVLAEETPLRIAFVSVPGTGLQVKLATQVGQPYDAEIIAKDLRYLWSLGRFDDIRVEASERDDGLAVIFRVTVSPHALLHEIRIVPNTYGLDIKVPQATPMDSLRASRIALGAQRQLNQEGYQNARVDYQLTPAAKGDVDLRLTVDIGDAIRVKEVRFEGDSMFRHDLQALRIRRMLPGVPYLWSGWRLLPSYSPEAVDQDVAHIHSLYVAKGFFDAQVRPGPVDIHGTSARVSVIASRGPQYHLDAALCADLLAQRRAAQLQGVLDFSAKIDSTHPENAPEIQLGPRYRVGRIEFTGNHNFRDSTIRSNLLIEEGDVFDEHRLRLSIARLNRAMLFETIDAKKVVVEPDPQTGFADVTFHLTERKRGSWRLSGPVGPISFAGPVEAALSARLPPWGRGVLELSTYTMSLGVFAFGRPLLPILNAPKALTPILALQRPYMPGEGWKSGLFWAPQLGWRNTAIGYVATQLQHRLAALVAGQRDIDTDLSLTVERPEGDAMMSCEPPKPRFGLLRAAGTITLNLLGTLPSL